MDFGWIKNIFMNDIVDKHTSSKSNSSQKKPTNIISTFLMLIVGLWYIPATEILADYTKLLIFLLAPFPTSYST